MLGYGSCHYSLCGWALFLVLSNDPCWLTHDSIYLSLLWILKLSAQSFLLETSFSRGLTIQEFLGFLSNTLTAPSHSLLQNSPPLSHSLGFHPQLAVFSFCAASWRKLIPSHGFNPYWQLPSPLPIILKGFSSDHQTHLRNCLQDMSTFNRSKQTHHHCTSKATPPALFSMSPPSTCDLGGKPESSTAPTCLPDVQTHIASHARPFIIWFIYAFPAFSPSIFHLELQPLWSTWSSSNTLCSLSLSKSFFKLLLLCGIPSPLLHQTNSS